MRCSLARSATTLLLVQSLFSGVVFSQQSSEATRPRRTQPEWIAPQNSAIIPPATAGFISGPEPRIRVALTTSTRSALISTTSKLMKASGATTMLALDSSRVRVEARSLSPLPTSNLDEAFRVMAGVAPSREEAKENLKEIEKFSGEDTELAYDTGTKTWAVVVGRNRSREEAEELMARLESAGFDATVSDVRSSSANVAEAANVRSTRPMNDVENKSGVRLTSRSSLPSREVIASSTSSGQLFSSSAPVAFASDDEQNVPVRYNDRPYRGRIEVFANLRGTLTVVNELGLEDYVRGVVANELSPGGYPAIEALKAQAIAARTYAMKNLGQFMAQGFDILPTTRSQVYRGLTSENPLSNRAVEETRGMIATYNGEPINALYTSTCGGRTEHSENIFKEASPYLRGHECAAEGAAALSPFTIKTTRVAPDLREEGNVPLARAVSLLAVHNFSSLPGRISDAWLSATAPVLEVRSWLITIAQLAKQSIPDIAEDANRPGAFSTALANAAFGDSRASTLMNDADVAYHLAVRDAEKVPSENRADVAHLLRDGFLTVHPDATLRPLEPMTRGRVLQAIVRVLDARNLLQVQKANARPSVNGQLILRSKGKDQPLRVNPDLFLFRQIGENFYPVQSVAIVGGEPVLFHVTGGQVDYLEVKPAPNGAAADRFSPFSNWKRELSVGQVQARLARASAGIGPIMDLRVVSRGSSRRATDLEIVGSNGSAHVRGGRIRSALGLREQLFVIDREFDENGRVSSFIFSGRGWGHGVGMCQVGAYGLAKQGLTSEQILKTYYTGIEVTRMY
jgi:stage II sporulation protein D